MSDDSPTASGATNVLLNQRSLTAPYHREAVGIQGDENPGKALGFDAEGRLTAIAVGGGSSAPANTYLRPGGTSYYLRP